MEIRIKTPTTVIVYPDLSGNLELPEDDRFGVELRKPSKQRISEAAVKIIYGDDGQAQTYYDSDGLARSWISRLVNAPMLEVDGRKRKMQVADMFRYDELAPVLKAVNEKIGEMSSTLDVEDDDSKN